MRRVLIGGLWGCAPGALFLTVVLVLHASDVITSDQSQIGFLGIPLLFFGLLFGMLLGAALARNTSSVLVWMGIGFIAGVVLSIALSQLIVGSWLIFVPLFILGGGVFGAWRHEHHPVPPSAIPH